MSRTRYRAEPEGTVQLSPTAVAAVPNCHELSKNISWIPHQLPTRQSCCPFIGDQCGRSLKQTSAKSSWPIGASLHVTSDRRFLQSCSDHRMRCNSQPTQAWLTAPCSGRWTNGRKQPFAGTERGREALTKRQRAIITF